MFNILTLLLIITIKKKTEKNKQMHKDESASLFVKK